MGCGFPKHISSFPYIRFYQDKGFRVIGGPTSLGDCLDDEYELPNFTRFIANIREFSKAVVREKAEGIITTAWWNFPPEILLPGLVAASQFSWNATVENK